MCVLTRHVRLIERCVATPVSLCVVSVSDCAPACVFITCVPYPVLLLTLRYTQDQATANRLSEWLSGLMHWASKQPRPLSFCAAVSAAAALPASLRAAGCLDCEVKVPALGLTGRAALLLSGFKAKGLGFSGGLQGLEALAGKGLEGFDAKDLQLVVDRAVHAALQRHMSSTHATAAAAAAAGASSADAAAAAGDADADADADAAPGRDTESAAKPQQQQQHLLVTAEDVQQALSGFVAAAFWRAGQHKGQQNKAEGGLQGWQDVGECLFEQCTEHVFVCVAGSRVTDLSAAAACGACVSPVRTAPPHFMLCCTCAVLCHVLCCACPCP